MERHEGILDRLPRDPPVQIWGSWVPENCLAALDFKTISFSNVAGMETENDSWKQFTKTISFQDGPNELRK